MFTVSEANLDQGVIRIPKTITPWSVSFWNIIVFGTIWGVLFFFFNFFWASVLTGLILAISVWLGGITDEEVDYHGHLLFNSFTRERRVIFPGLHQKAFWESMEEGSRKSLRRIISSVGEENLPTNDPAENMKVHLTIHKRMNLGKVGEDKEAADNFIRFHSIDAEALSTVVRKEIVKKFSGYYGDNEMEKLTNADAVQKAVFDSAETSIKEKIQEMRERWGIYIGLILDTSNPDEATKDMKRTPAKAEALASAMKRLEESISDSDMRRRVALILDSTNDYNEERFDLHVDAPDLKNLQHASFMGFGEKGKGGKKS